LKFVKWAIVDPKQVTRGPETGCRGGLKRALLDESLVLRAPNRQVANVTSGKDRTL
jgi:hypothetical protein